MADAIIVINAGSSSLKFSVFIDGAEDCEPLFSGQIESLLGAPRFVACNAAKELISEHRWEEGTRLGHDGAVRHLFEWGQSGRLGGHSVKAVGHRVVHGGLKYTQPVLVNQRVLDQLQEFTALALLHQPRNLSVIRIIAAEAPHLAQVACFDTSFHRGHPFVEETFALPRRLTDAGIRRYGFHGLSYESIASKLPEVDRQAAEGRTVVAHLGSGASMCALRAGRSVASTMTFTALDGLPMGTRSGSIDPGVLLYLMDEYEMDARGLERLLYQESGLLGVSCVSNDMRVLLESDDPRAEEAIDLFVYRIGRELGSLAAALGGLDALVFTAGIGENSATVRASICRDAAWLGLELDEAANETGGPRISRPESAVSAWVIPTDEELMIARHTRRVVAGGADSHE